MSRTDARSTSLRHRPARTVPATIVAVVLLLLGIGLVWVAVLKLANGTWPTFLGSVNSWLTGLTWGATLALVIAIAVLVVGLVLLIAALAPGKPNAMVITNESAAEAQDSTGKTEYVMTRRSVAKLASAQADLVDGVDGVSVTTTARQVKLRVKTASEQTGDISQTVTDRVREALTATGLKPLPRVSTTARTTKP